MYNNVISTEKCYIPLSDHLSAVNFLKTSPQAGRHSALLQKGYYLMLDKDLITARGAADHEEWAKFTPTPDGKLTLATYREGRVSADEMQEHLMDLAHGLVALPRISNAEAEMAFAAAWERMAGEEVPYEKSFANGTEYFNPVLSNPSVVDKGSCRFTDDQGRKALVLHDALSDGNAVIFQRFTDQGFLAFNARVPGVRGSGSVDSSGYIGNLLNEAAFKRWAA